MLLKIHNSFSMSAFVETHPLPRKGSQNGVFPASSDSNNVENPDVHSSSFNVSTRLMLGHHFVFRRNKNSIDEIYEREGSLQSC